MNLPPCLFAPGFTLPLVIARALHSNQLVNSRRPALGFIFVTLVLDVLGIGLIIPILPKLVESFLGGSVPAASHAYGLLAALYSCMQFLCAPILGNLSDRFGRRPGIL